MAKPTLLHPQFFRTLVHGFHTHLMIPVDFFSQYVEGKSVVEKTTAELRSDSSDITWKVKMTGRRLSDGWEEFAVANNLQIGDVAVVRYEGDMVFHVSGLGPNCCDITVPSNNINDGQDDIGDFVLKKHTHPRTDVGDDDDEELPRKKKVKKNSLDETEAVSSSLDNSCFVANVTASNLCTDTLYLPQHFTSSNGLTRNCRKIVLIDGGERSWALDLMFEESSDTFYISRGWRSFCDENGENAGGGFFTFKLVGNGETPVLSCIPTESINNRRHGDCSEASRRESLSTKLCNEEEDIEGERNEDECKMEIEKKKYNPKRRVSSYASYSPCHKRSVAIKLPPDYDRIGSLSLPTPFLRENGINKPGEMYLLGKDGTKWPTNLLLDKKGTMSLGKGWKDFVKANGLNTGESFTLKLIWKETIPMLSLCCAESTSDREQEGFSKAIEKQSIFIDPSNKDKISKDEGKKEESRSMERGRDSTASSQNQFVTFTITPYSVEKCILPLPKKFVREIGINKSGMITLVGKDGIKHKTKLHFHKGNNAALGDGWKYFVKANGLKTGDSFTLKLIWEDTTPVLSLCPAECSIDRGAGGGCSETDQKKSIPIEPSSCEKISKDENSKEKNNKEENRKEETMSMERGKNHLRERDSATSSQKQFVTLKITPSCFSHCKLTLPARFARENSMNKPGMVYLLGKDGTKWMVNLVQERGGRMNLGKGWKDFAKANDLKTGESFTMELIWEDETRMLRLVHSKSSSSKANEKESISTEPRSRDSSSAIQNRTVTLALTPEDVKACKLHLPSQFMRANGINKLGKITLLGENKMEWFAYLLSIRDGTVALEIGWEEFCEANGVKLGESFTLEFVYELDTVIVLKFCSR